MRARAEEGGGERGAELGSIVERRMRAGKDLPELGGPWRTRMGYGPAGRSAERSQARQRSQAGREGRLRQERSVSKGAGFSLAVTGSGRERVEREVRKRMSGPELIFQASGEISTKSR